jgi:hypothetical protein
MENHQNTQPVVVDLGKQKSKRIKKLRKGDGPLPAKLDAAIREARSRLGTDKSIVPVIVVYEKKAQRKLAGLPFFGPF